MTQACFVPSSTRGYDPRGCLFMLNAPDTYAGRVITEPEVRLASIEACCKGFEDVTRHNNNIFVLSFESRTKAKDADHALELRFSIQTMDTAAPIAPSLTISPSQYVRGPHHVYCCSIKVSSIKHTTIYEREFEALHGPRSASFQLLRQNGTNDHVRYLLRRPASASPIHIERFYIPVDHASGIGKTWATFKPSRPSRKCQVCGEQCQAGEISTCPYAVVMSRPRSSRISTNGTFHALYKLPSRLNR
jgi:hypothetical protein